MRGLTLSLIFGLLLLPGFIIPAFSQTSIVDEFQMKQYYLVLLTAGPNRTQDSASAAKIQEGHLNNISRLLNDKKMVLAGPFLDDGLYLGIFIFDVATDAEVYTMLQSDPAIKAGRLGYEIHPWYGPGNIRIK